MNTSIKRQGEVVLPSYEACRVVTVEPLEHHRLLLTFDGGEQRIFDAMPLLERGVFRSLADETYFAQVRVAYDGVAWPGEQDLSPDTLYALSAPAIRRAELRPYDAATP